MKALYDKVSIRCSIQLTKRYTTSFYLGILMLDKSLRAPIYAIYGFVRLADEIVDTFHDYPQEKLLDRFMDDTWQAIEQGISLNPILHSFQQVVREYQIDKPLIEQFFQSMQMDLTHTTYTPELYDEYILGSAEVVGLMCLKVFCKGDAYLYKSLKPGAMKLGSAFQKINFLRDLKADREELGRTYFPDVDLNKFDLVSKKKIEEEIHQEFNEALESIKKLPPAARRGVYIAYLYYSYLLMKIKKSSPETLLQRRVRIPNWFKVYLLLKARLQLKLKMI